VQDLNPELENARREIERLRIENAGLRTRLGFMVAEPVATYEAMPSALLFEQEPLSSITEQSSLNEKVGLFRSLFNGREDVYAAFWLNENLGEPVRNHATIG